METTVEDDDGLTRAEAGDGESDVSSVLVGLGARDRTQAVIAAFESGLLEPS